jgi:hypothetical protein
VFTSREKVAMSREALRSDVANARFEGSLVLSHKELIANSLNRACDIRTVVLRANSCWNVCHGRIRVDSVLVPEALIPKELST